jgi:hypothetical protein
MAYILFFVLRIGNSDALSRTANAYYVLYSRDPHLAAIGFIWPASQHFTITVITDYKSTQYYSFYR